MKKTLIRFVGVVLLFILASAGSGNYYGVEVGEQAPNFEVSNETHSLQLQSLRGKYVVVTFWSSADADSRIANMMHDRAASSNENLEHVALNFDESQPLWNTILRTQRGWCQVDESVGTKRRIYFIAHRPLRSGGGTEPFRKDVESTLI